MNPPTLTAPSSLRTADPLRVALAFSLLVSAASCLGGPLNIAAPSQLTLPSASVASFPQTVTSAEYTLEIHNRNEANGWLLSADLTQGHLVGDLSGVTIPASIAFKSITWISGGQGSSAGIAISPDGSRIEADPGFGIGKYSVVFEIQYDVPAFPVADSYRGDTVFIVQ